MFENIKKLLSATEDYGIPAMEITLWHKGKEVFHETRGIRDEDGSKLLGGELYNAYSCSKVITCAAVMKLVEEGKIRLSDNIADYLEAFRDMNVLKNGSIVKAEKKITVFHLLNMSAGLTYNIESPEIELGKKETEGRCPTVKMMEYIAKMPLAYEPGEDWQYSLAHDVLAALVEVVSKKRFGEYINENFFEPLGMKNSTFLLPKEKIGNVCSQYLYNNGVFENIGPEIRRYKLGFEYESGGAGLVTTARDYVLFLEGMRTYRLLSRDTIAKMTKDYLSEHQRIGYQGWGVNRYGYGLGVRVPLSDGKRTDYGWGGAAGAMAFIDEPHEFTLYYSQHVLSSPVAHLRKDYVEAAKLDLGYTDAFIESMWQGGASTLA